MEALVHVANVLFLVSYVVRGVVWLRALTIVAILTLVPYYLFHGLVTPVLWSAVFVTINSVQLTQLLLRQRAAGREESSLTARAVAEVRGYLLAVGRELRWLRDLARTDRVLRHVGAMTRAHDPTPCSTGSMLVIAHT